MPTDRQIGAPPAPPAERQSPYQVMQDLLRGSEFSSRQDKRRLLRYVLPPGIGDRPLEYTAYGLVVVRKTRAQGGSYLQIQGVGSVREEEEIAEKVRESLPQEKDLFLARQGHLFFTERIGEIIERNAAFFIPGTENAMFEILAAHTNKYFTPDGR